MKIVIFTLLLLSTAFLVSADKFDDDVLSVRKGTFTAGASATELVYSDVLSRFVYCFPEETVASFRCFDPEVTTEAVMWIQTAGRVDVDRMSVLSANRVVCVKPHFSLLVWIFLGDIFVCGAAPSYV